MTELVYKDLSYQVRGIIFKVYNTLGPGFMEKIYRRAIVEELKTQSVNYEVEKRVNVKYGTKLIGFNSLDLVIDGKLLLEIKAVNRLEGFHESQVLAYLKASGLKLGILVNFGSRLEVKRFVNL